MDDAAIFSTQWLDLRERADICARNPHVIAAIREYFQNFESIAFMDLGTGTGATVRSLAEHLPQNQFWYLVDHDDTLLQAARTRLKAWADAVLEDTSFLRLQKGQTVVQVSFMQADLCEGLVPLLGRSTGIDLVTTSALLDLVSKPWIESLAQTLALYRLPFYAALTCTGEDIWQPAHELDHAIFSAFHHHQGRDKGFGPAVGHQGMPIIERAFSALSFRCVTENSPWQLEPSDDALLASLIAGTAQAALETGMVTSPQVKRWIAERTEMIGQTFAHISHADFFASPTVAGGCSPQ